jgi:hypothetical protein
MPGSGEPRAALDDWQRVYERRTVWSATLEAPLETVGTNEAQ